MGPMGPPKIEFFTKSVKCMTFPGIALVGYL